MIRSGRQSAWGTMDGDSWHCTGGGDQDHPQEKEMQKGKTVVWGDLTNSCENKRSETFSDTVQPPKCYSSFFINWSWVLNLFAMEIKYSVKALKII